MTLKSGFGKRSKHALFVFPPKKTLIWGGHCSIGQWSCSMTSKRSIDWFLESSRAWEVFSPERSLNQSKATSVCIRSTNQSYCSISVRLCFLFCSRVFISRSYENRSMQSRVNTKKKNRYSTKYLKLNRSFPTRCHEQTDSATQFHSKVFFGYIQSRK